MNEFEIIQHFFAQPHHQRPDVILGIGDDAAVVQVPDHQQLVITTDTLIANVHFPAETAADDIGFKALAVNLSDLAAMGATPAWVTLALTIPHANETWLTKFSRGFFSLAAQHNVQLIGGDLTHGPLTITVQAMGLVPKNQAIKRSGANVNDLIYVTHQLGDAALGLACIKKTIDVPAKFQPEIITKLNRPQPRIAIGEQLRGIASAAIDISDGLAADLKHILTASHVGAHIIIDDLPLSAVLRAAVTSQQAIELALSGGDDYELCFTVPKAKQTAVPAHCTCIGEITATPGLDLRFADGMKYELTHDGYQHFK